ncbi:hypothetical protein [Aequorivita echinoideorum]|uniref:Uncharacterized protein n=1 Tax=Aequorivita echinoideorum TaxID=1549647 RepID=A0ABS5S0P9_9FLAO|nr:hypothetical protein [Aequorivita echinoideorum]MBT0606782.1 hypothetical protein [Aequorivita echinoideorum]
MSIYNIFIITISVNLQKNISYKFSKKKAIPSTRSIEGVALLYWLVPILFKLEGDEGTVVEGGGRRVRHILLLC